MDEEMKLNICDNIRLVRLKRGISPNALAARLPGHRTNGYIKSIEAGTKRNISTEELMDFAKALHTPLHKLIHPVNQLIWVSKEEGLRAVDKLKALQKKLKFSDYFFGDFVGVYGRNWKNAVTKNKKGLSVVQIWEVSDRLGVKPEELIDNENSERWADRIAKKIKA